VIRKLIYTVLLASLGSAGWVLADEPAPEVSGSSEAQPVQALSDSLVDEIGSTPPAALSMNEPMYFILGKQDGDTKARFQFSFKYRLFDEQGVVLNTMPFLKNLHFAYTQTSLWNLSEESAPFEDTSYRPSLFWDVGQKHDMNMATFARFGYEHESNGKDGDASRSIDSLFMTPGVVVRVLNQDVMFATRLNWRFNKADENQDIANFRGYGDLVVRFGNDDSTVVQLMHRPGKGGRYSTQVDVSVPIRDRIFNRTGAFIYVQAFDGHGESMLNYNQRANFNVRLGLAIVR